MEMIELISGARLPGRDTLLDVWIGADGRISAVTPAGTVTEHGGVRASAAQTLTAAGRVVTSGLWDEHVHMGQWAQQASRPDFFSCEGPGEALARVREWFSAADAPTELIGMRLRGGEWGGLTKAQLDAVSGERPVVLLSIDLHGAWLNTAALRRYGFDSAREGRVVEGECFALTTQLDRLPDEELDRRVSVAASAAAALGVVGIVDFEMRWGVADWERRAARGFSSLRVESAIYPQFLDRAISEGVCTGTAIGSGGRTTVGPVKVITDGSLGTRTAWCCDPYPDGGFGLELVSPADLTALLRRAHAAGFTAAVHAIGDRANAQALDAFAASGATGRVEHAQLLRPADLTRFAELGIAASMQPAHLLDDILNMRMAWPDRANNAFPLASLLRNQAAVIFGSDAPVAPLDPWLGIAAAVARAREGEPPWVAAEQLTVAEALACSMRGPLRPSTGDIADLMLLDHDPIAAADPQAEWEAPAVAATLLGGTITHLS